MLFPDPGGGRLSGSRKQAASPRQQTGSPNQELNSAKPAELLHILPWTEGRERALDCNAPGTPMCEAGGCVKAGEVVFSPRGKAGPGTAEEPGVTGGLLGFGLRLERGHKDSRGRVHGTGHRLPSLSNGGRQSVTEGVGAGFKKSLKTSPQLPRGVLLLFTQHTSTECVFVSGLVPAARPRGQQVLPLPPTGPVSGG